MQKYLGCYALLGLFFIQAIFVISTTGTAGKCGRTPVDVVFVLDESGSIWGPHFTQQLQFIQDLIDGFDFGPNGTRVGVETFGNNVRTITQLGEITNAEQLKRIVAGIHQLRGSTGTHLALARLREMFSGRHIRPGASRVAVVITDGESDDPRLTAIEAEKVHAEGIAVFAIGVGVAVKREELHRIASQPDYVFTVDNYDELNSLLSILATKACPIEESETTHQTASAAKTPKPTTWPEPAPATRTFETQWRTAQTQTISWDTPKLFTFRPVTPKITGGCEQSVTFNVYFGLPNQLSALDTYLALQFIRDLTAILNQTPSVIRPTLCPRICIPTDSSSSLDFLAALDDRLTESVTPHNLQLEYIRKQEEDYRQRNPVEGKDLRTAVAVLLLDNRLANMERMLRQVSLAHREGIQVMTIGVGDYVDLNELWRLATTEKDAKYVRSYCQLPTIRDDVLQRVCTRGLVQSTVEPAL